VSQHRDGFSPHPLSEVATMADHKPTTPSLITHYGRARKVGPVKYIEGDVYNVQPKDAALLIAAGWRELPDGSPMRKWAKMIPPAGFEVTNPIKIPEAEGR
jgi:hypothetical protein